MTAARHQRLRELVAQPWPDPSWDMTDLMEKYGPCGCGSPQAPRWLEPSPGEFALEGWCLDIYGRHADWMVWWEQQRVRADLA